MGSERNIPTLMFSFTFTSMHLATRPTTSGWERRRETGDQVRLPLPWCLERNTHNHERRRKTGDRGPGTSTPALMFRPKRPTITDGLDPAVEEEDDDVKNLFAEMNDATCRRWRSTKEICHLQKMKDHQGNSRIAITELMIMSCNNNEWFFM